MAIAASNHEFLDVGLIEDEVLHGLDVSSLLGIDSGEHDCLEWLTNINLRGLADAEHKGGNCLCQLHLTLKSRIGCSSLREGGKVNRFTLVTTRNSIKVEEQLVAIEWSNGCHELGNCLKTGIERLVGCQLVVIHLTAPETLAVQTNIPVGKVVAYKGLDETSGNRRLIVVKVALDSFDEGVERRKYPSVNLRTLFQSHLGLLASESIDVGIECKELVGIEERAEEFAAHFYYAFWVELEVVPRRSICNHIPTERIGTISLDGAKGIDSIAQALRHLLAVLGKDKTIRHNSLVGYRVEYHCGDSVEGEEPTTGLVNTLGDEVGWINTAIVEGFLVFEWIVNLCVWHRTRIKPYINKVKFTSQDMSCLADELDIIHVRTVEVNLLVIIFLHQAGHKTLFLEWVLLHDSSCNSFLDLVIEFLDGANAQFLAGVTIAPDGQWCTPIARTAEVPIVEVFKPSAKASGTRRFRFPVDGLVEFDHPVATSGGTDEPRVERIIEHGLVGTPAMGIVVHMLLNLESLAVLLESKAHNDIEVIGFLGCSSIILAVLVELGRIGILHEATFMNAIGIEIDTLLNKGGSEFFTLVVLTRQVNHRTWFTQQIDHV